MRYLFSFLGKPPSPIFAPEPCANRFYIGAACDVPNNPCELLNPCSSDGRCILDAMAPAGYRCLCFSKFSYGRHCEFNHRPCPSGTDENQTLRKPLTTDSSEHDVEVAAKKRRVYQILSKSIGSSAILIIAGFITWVIIMDILKNMVLVSIQFMKKWSEYDEKSKQNYEDLSSFSDSSMSIPPILEVRKTLFLLYERFSFKSLFLLSCCLY